MRLSKISGHFVLALIVLAALHVAPAGTAWAAPTFGTAGPDAVATFHSIGLYWAPPQGSATNIAGVQFRPLGTLTWRQGLDLWFDSRNKPAPEYRGSLVELTPGTTYEIQLTLKSSGGAVLFSETLQASTWSETFPVPAGHTVTVPAGTTRIVIRPTTATTPSTSMTGTALTINAPTSSGGFTRVTATPGQNVIAASASAPDDACIDINHGTRNVIVAGLVLQNCKRVGVLFQRGSSTTTFTDNIVFDGNEIVGWGGFNTTTGFPRGDGAIHCNYDGANVGGVPLPKPRRIIMQRNVIRDPRFDATPWGPNHIHPEGPQAVAFFECGNNHVFRYNEVHGDGNGHHYMDAIGGGSNFSDTGFPGADSDIYGNRISNVYDDGIEAEGGNRNVRIWGNYLDRVMVAIANAATSVGPLYVWRNVSNDMAGLADPTAPNEGVCCRGTFIKAASADASFNGGRAYYFHNTALQPPPQTAQPYPRGAGEGINDSGCCQPLYNIVSLNNIWHIHRVPPVDGETDYVSIVADCNVQGPCTADYDLFNGRVLNASNPNAPEIHGFGNPANGDESSVPTYATSGGTYPATTALPSSTNGWSGDFTLSSTSRGYHGGLFLPNFNDLQHPDPGAHQSGTPPMRFGLAAAEPQQPDNPVGPTARLSASPLSGTAALQVSFDASGSTAGSSPITTYGIDFGDGTSGSGVTQSHSYGAGTYTATLTVTDANGLRSTDTKTIQVAADTVPAFSGTSAFRLFVSVSPGLVITPSAGERLDFSVSAADGRALQKVRFFVDAAHKLTDTAAPFQFAWAPAAAATGTQIVLAEATDTAGNVAIEARTVTLLATTCSILVSATSVTQGEPIDIEGRCSASRTVERMEFFVDDVLQSPNRDATPPYTWAMDTRAFAVGTHTLRARGVGGNVAIGEDSVTIQIIAPPLTLTISPGTVVQRTEDVTITASATDGRALRQVDFFIDGSFRAGEQVAPFQFVWRASAASPRPDGFGRHLLVVQATDLNGNVLTATRDLYVLTQTCNVLVATSQFMDSSFDTVLVAPHTIVQGQTLIAQGLCTASQTVTQIDVFIDGVQAGSDVIAPYGWPLATSSLTPGSHTLAIRALFPNGTQSNHSTTFEVVAP